MTSPAPSSQGFLVPLIVGLSGIVVGLGGAVIYLGGNLRQVEITKEDVAELRSGGSPQAQALRLQFDDLRTQVQRNSETINKLPIADMELRTEYADVARRLERIEAAGEKNVETLSRLSAAEGEIKRLIETSRRLDDRFNEHEREDHDLLKSQRKAD